jgi:hypothetical protein
VVRPEERDPQGGPVIVPARFNGPPNTANGGYTAGMLATYLNHPDGAVVTLRRPPPLETPMDVRTVDGGIANGGTTNGGIANGGITLYHGERLIASASPVAAPLSSPVPGVSWASAMEVSASFPGFVSHPFPTCFGCGPERPPGDGLRLFPGRLPDGRCAAAWVVPEDIEATLVWAALDCPGGWSIALESRPYVLGRLSARVDAVPAAGDGCVVMGALVATEGRKAEVLSTVYGPDGRMLALSRATWIALAS